MWYLNKSTQSLKAITLEAVNAVDLDYTTVYHSVSGRLNIGPTTGTGTIDEVLTTIVPAPNQDTQADIKNIVVSNTDDIDHNLVFYFSEGTDKIIFKCLLQPDWSAIWEQETGWTVYNEKGIELVSLPTIDWSDITGDPETNQNLVDQINEQIIDSLRGLSDYFFYGDASDIGGYYDMRLNASLGTVETISNAGVVNGATLVSFATLSGFPNITLLPAGVVKFRVYSQKTSGTQVAQLYAEFYKRDIGATETLICTSGNSIAIAGAAAQYEFSCATAVDTVLAATDRLVVKIKALITGAGTAPNIDILCEGSSASRIELPITNIDLSNYVTKDGTEALTNKASYNGLVVSANTGVITTGSYQATSIETGFTDAKIKGSVAATAGLIAFGTGVADTVTTDTNFRIKNTSNQQGLIFGGTNVDVWLAGAVTGKFLTIQTTTSNELAIVNIAASGTGVAATNYGNATIRRAAFNVVNGSNIEIYTNPTNSGTGLTKVFELTSLGNVVLGAQAALATSATNGHTYIPTCAGTPTGVPTAYTGKVAMVYDTTNNKFYIYNAGWKGGTAPGTFS